MMKRFASTALAIALVATLVPMAAASTAIPQATANQDTLTISGTEHYDMAHEALAIVNKERVALGYAPLQFDAELMETAMLRAAEVSVYYGYDEHSESYKFNKRPDGSEWSTAFPVIDDSEDYFRGESVAAGQKSAAAVMQTWLYDARQVYRWEDQGIELEDAIAAGNYRLPSGVLITEDTSDRWVSISYENIISPDYKSTGIGCFYQGGVFYWQQSFDSAEATGSVKSGKVDVTRQISVDYDCCGTNQALNADLDSQLKPSLAPGETFDMHYCINNDGRTRFNCVIDADNAVWTSSNPDVCAVDQNGTVTAKLAGTATITATLPSGRSASYEWVVKLSLEDAVVSDIPHLTYTGYRIKPDPTVTLGGKRLIAGTDYTLSYANNINAGSDARIILTGIGDYAGSKTVRFEIGPAPITSATPNYTQFTYDGTEKKPVVTVKSGNKVLGEGDYQISWLNDDMTSVGTKVIEVSGLGNYGGTVRTTYEIVAADASQEPPTPGTPSKPDAPDQPEAQDPDAPEEPDAPAAQPQTMYRLYNPNSGEHFYTSSDVERSAVVAAGWIDEGVGWTAPDDGIQVYRLYNPNAGEHHYTISVEERDMLVSVGWIWEEGGWFSDPDQAVPLYRAYNPNAYSNNHHYTADPGEFQRLIYLGWVDEGVGWYGVG